MKTRDIIAVATLSIFTLSTWGSMWNIVSLQVWNRKFALAAIRASFPNPVTYNSQELLEETYISYLTKRYIFFFPHVFGALLWWNLFFLQLIPSLRKKYKKLHRWMGRILLLAVICQVLSGVALAYNGYSATIAWFSYILAIGTIVSVYHTAKNAMKRNFSSHKYWALRLVGYLQAISGQRFWTIVAISCQHAGVFRNMEHPPYPQLEEDSSPSLVDAVVLRMFHDSFIVAGIVAFVGTELYLAAAVWDGAFEDTNVKTNSNIQERMINDDEYQRLPTNSFKSYSST